MFAIRLVSHTGMKLRKASNAMERAKTSMNGLGLKQKC
jgi:hypothetical protein